MLREFLLKILSFRDIDSHYIITILGIQLKIKHKHKAKDIILKESGVTETPREIPVIVSLTSFPARLETTILAIKTLLVQTMKPDKVILWLAEEDFPKREEDLPQRLLELKDYGLTIDWHPNLRSFKKLIPALKKYPEAVIITVDDDIYYAEDTVESLYNSYLKNPDCIHSNRCARIKVKDGKIINIPSVNLYNKHFPKPSYYNRLSGYGGTLYPPHCLSDEVFNKEFFFNKLKTHDDIWFWAAAVLNRTKVKVVKGYSESVYTIEDSQAVALCKVNRISTTDKAYTLLLESYPQILDILGEEQQ